MSGILSVLGMRVSGSWMRGVVFDVMMFPDSTQDHGGERPFYHRLRPRRLAAQLPRGG